MEWNAFTTLVLIIVILISVAMMGLLSTIEVFGILALVLGGLIGSIYGLFWLLHHIEGTN